MTSDFYWAVSFILMLVYPVGLGYFIRSHSGYTQLGPYIENMDAFAVMGNLILGAVIVFGWPLIAPICLLVVAFYLLMSIGFNHVKAPSFLAKKAKKWGPDDR